MKTFVPARPPIYLDHNATTPLAPGVADAMRQSLEEDFGNPSSSHLIGEWARRVMEEARDDVAGFLGCAPDEVVFTGGGSEADNLALKGVALLREGGHIITCAGEHPAVLEPCRFLEKRGYRVTRLPIDGEGRVEPDAVRRAIEPDTILISVMHANNETGTLQPIAEIGRIARQRRLLFHSDGAQAAGKLPVRVRDLGVDLYTVAGHKLGGPKGIGALYVGRGVELEPHVHGGGQEAGRRSGTEAIHQMVGLAAACQIADEGLAEYLTAVPVLRDHLHQLLVDGIPDLSLNGHPVERLPNTLNVSFPGVSGADLLAEASRVAASTGSACHSGDERLSPVLAAMGVPLERGRGAVRLSLGRSTTEADVGAAADGLISAYRRLRKR